MRRYVILLKESKILENVFLDEHFISLDAYDDIPLPLQLFPLPKAPGYIATLMDVRLELERREFKPLVIRATLMEFILGKFGALSVYYFDQSQNLIDVRHFEMTHGVLKEKG